MSLQPSAGFIADGLLVFGPHGVLSCEGKPRQDRLGLFVKL